MKRLICCAILLTSAASCGRDAGPHDREHGRVMFWQIQDSSVAFENCTDAEAWQEPIRPPSFKEGTFIVYRISDDGRHAVTQACESTDASTCQNDGLGVVFDVDESQLVYDPAAEIRAQLSSRCTLLADHRWTMVDEGTALTLDVDISFSLHGDAAACQALDDEVRAAGTNGHGMDECTVALTIASDFFRSDRP